MSDEHLCPQCGVNPLLKRRKLCGPCAQHNLKARKKRYYLKASKQRYVLPEKDAA